MSKYGEPERGTRNWDVPLKDVFDNIEIDVDSVRAIANANTSAIGSVESGAFSAFTDETNVVSKTGTREITVSGVDVSSEYTFRRAILPNGLTANLNHVASSEFVGGSTVITTFEDITPSTVTSLKKGILPDAVPLSENRPVAKPVFVSPLEGATNLTSVTLEVDPIRLLYSGDTLDNTTFWLTSDPEGKNIVYGPVVVSGDVSLSVDTDDLTVSTTYYAFATQESSGGDVSLPSDPRSFTTAASFFSRFAGVIGGSGVELFNDVKILDGNVYAVGSETTSGNSQGFVVKFDTSGDVVWQRKVGDSSTETFFGVDVDSSGNVYAVGSTDTPNNQALIVKLDSSGSVVWQRTLGGAGFEEFKGVAVGGTNVYAVGRQSATSALVAKYSSAGSLVWQKTFAGSGDNILNGVAADEGEAVYVGGYVNSSDPFLAQITSEGAFGWQRAFDTTFIYGMSLDPSGNVYGCGIESTSSGGTNNGFAIKINSSGAIVWQKTFGAAGSAMMYGISSPLESDVYVGGYETSSAQEAFVVKLDSIGDSVWQRSLGGSGADRYSGVHASSGGLVAGGQETSTGATQNALIVAMESDAAGATGTLPTLTQLSWTTPSIASTNSGLTATTTSLTISDSSLTDAASSFTVSDSALTYTKSSY